MSDAFALQACNVHKSYPTLEVLRGVDFAVAEGERVGIVGASGSGKSTLLHLLGTLDQPTTGEILYAGRRAPLDQDQEISRFRNEHLGFVFQFHHLLADFSALENVMMPCLAAGMERSQAAQQARAVLQQVGLEARLTHRPAELSGGEQQRVAMARALIRRPKLLIADEPTGNLDAESGQRVYELLCQLHREMNSTLIVATHNRELAERMDALYRLKDGKLERER